jgi:hypothetical protein
MTEYLSRYALAALILQTASHVSGAELKPEAVTAWEQNVQAANARMNARLKSGAKFLWIDEQPSRLVQVKRGKIEVEPVGVGAEPVPTGLVHDWIGTAFIPGASVDNIKRLTGAYDHYKEIYGPAVVDSRNLSNSGRNDRFSLRLLQKTSLATCAMEIGYEAHSIRVDDKRWYAISYSTSIREIRNYGKPDETELPPDEGNGFLWRLYSITRYQQGDGGVFVELEVMALTRDIPALLRWIVKPLVARMSRNSLAISLTKMRDAVRSGKYSESESTSLPRAVEVPGRTGFRRNNDGQ